MFGSKGDDVKAAVRKIDATMLTLASTVRQLGIPKGMGDPLNKMRRAVGDLVAHLSMTTRRDD
ncbi:hypothetical protein GCM10011581_43540 [Saccharopolyspora subtropica]|uniref:Uncharacterized protein n=1 Tax=Saccharopolyspora thermophila TaxID=89367 RepID=A0A917K7H7_9PSEU|nr:hypothetical protein [Saccharopolyspora subtropica]GGJ01620.1 hypothetical protein GCM10011581_43540 [Saccharopolyspora subtropica]